MQCTPGFSSRLPRGGAGRDHRERQAMQKAVRKEKMKVIERPTTLRDTLEWLKAEGDLIETDKPVDPDLEVTGLQKHLDGACPMLFNKVKRSEERRVGKECRS